MKLGLTDIEVENSRNKYGSNILTEPKRRTLLKIILESFSDPIIKIMLIALSIKIVFLFKDFNWYETLGILIAIFLATLISTLSEYGSIEAFKKLQESNKDIICKVYRNGKLCNIKSSLIVKDDLIFLESGDIVPADVKLVSGSLSVDESILTGESKSEEKKINDKLYKGTTIYDGSANCIVIEIANNTMYGKIASEISEEKNVSPLKLRLLSLSKIINRIGYIGAFLVSISFLFSKVIISNNFDINLITKYISSKNMIEDLIYTLTLCVTTIVVAVPEGLPMMITLVLSSNMKRMVKDNVLIKKMVGIETSGNINYLLTDKTGTITTGKLVVTEYITPDLLTYKDISLMDNNIKDYILESLIYNSSSSINNKNIIGGNSTDKCILEFIRKDYKIRDKNYMLEPFNSDKKYSKVNVDKHTYIKGAFDKVLSLCNYSIDHNGNINKLNKKIINNYLKNLLSKGYRILANMDCFDDKNILLGFIVIKDNIRKESIEGIRLIKNAGISVIMITGDYKDTAEAIAKETGIITSQKDISLSSPEFNKLSDEDIIEKVNNIKLISRALPSDKSRLVRLLQESGNIVGMTGDGINDAPALKKADVSFAMGSGTNVAKETSDIIILDNNLLSISKAIIYGRTIFKSIRKFIVYQLSVNLCALTLSIIGPLIGVSAPITIVQMLWLNMIMDTFAGLAFSFEPPLKRYLNEKPLDKNKGVINKKMYIEIITNGFYSALICILFLKLPFIRNILGGSKKYFMTSYFALFIFFGIFNAFSCRTSRINLLKDINKNKLFLFMFIFITFAQILIIYYGGNIFSTYGLKIKDLLFVIVLSSSTIFINMVRKIYTKKMEDD